MALLCMIIIAMLFTLIDTSHPKSDRDRNWVTKSVYLYNWPCDLYSEVVTTVLFISQQWVNDAIVHISYIVASMRRHGRFLKLIVQKKFFQ